MKTTLAWLKTHLETDASPEAIAERLIMLGHDVEGVENRAENLDPFTVASVISAERHPNADRLRVCVVDTGKEEVQVVCGAPNAHAGMKGVFAPAGTVIPRTGALLRETVIRGVVEGAGKLVARQVRGQAGQRPQPGQHAVVDLDRAGERGAAVNYPVAGGVGVTQ